VTSSRHVNAWIEAGEPGAKQIAILRRAMADSQALIYLGFAEESGLSELETSLGELQGRREKTARRLDALLARRDSIGRNAGPASQDEGEPLEDATVVEQKDAEPSHDIGASIAGLELAELSREIGDAKRMLATLEKQIAARTRALPLYKATLETDGFADELRVRRDHPMHSLLRRMYHEKREAQR